MYANGGGANQPQMDNYSYQMDNNTSMGLASAQNMGPYG